MRSHQDIVKETGALPLHRLLEAHGVPLAPSTTQRWAERKSIPSEYWSALVELGLTNLEELAAGSAARLAERAEEKRADGQDAAA